MTTKSQGSLGGRPILRDKLSVAPGILCVLSLHLIIFAYERGMVPIYGHGPTSRWLDETLLVCMVPAFFLFQQVHPTRIWLYTALLLSSLPNATYWVAVWTSRRRSPVMGPIIAHIAVMFPVLSILSGLLREVTPPQVGRRRMDGLLFRAKRMAVVFLCVGSTSRKIWVYLPIINQISDSDIYLSLAALFYCACIFNYPSPAAPRNKSQRFKYSNLRYILLTAFMAVWWSLHTKLASPILPHPLPAPYDHPAFPLRIHSSVQSTTGLISVGEALPPPGHNGEMDQDMHSLRYLRASHSILGGVWVGSKVMTIDDESPLVDSFGSALGDSIYATFVLQEAVRLVNTTTRGSIGKWENALTIGLGTGISATSFSRHGISNTIVEIDPAVYNAARTYFGLPDPGLDHVFLEDARAWVSRRKANIEAGNADILFDIVVHDCFSGGGVPEHIYTLEFWNDLKPTMHPEGIIVVNFAGMVQSDSSRMIYHTLLKAFGQCRAFHDLFTEVSEDTFKNDFINMVFFCTSSRVPLNFREPIDSDYLGSPMRRHVLSSLGIREVNLTTLQSPGGDDKFILTDKRNPLGRLQAAQGGHHWALMRQVLPDTFWETF